MNLIALYLNYCNESFHINITLKKTKIIVQRIYKNSTVNCEESKIVSFVSSRIKNILLSPWWYKIAVKLVCWIALGLASKTLQWPYNFFLRYEYSQPLG